MHPSNRPTVDDLDELFTYHPPTDEQRVAYEKIREAAKHFAAVVLRNTPACADQSAAVRKVREAVMTANAAVALDQKEKVRNTVKKVAGVKQRPSATE